MRMPRIDRGTAGLACGIVAIVIAADGPATAANLISGSRLKNKTVSGKKLKSSAVTTDKIKGGAVRESDLGSNAVTTSKIRNGAVGLTDLSSSAAALFTAAPGAGSISAAQLADNSVTSAKVVDGAVTGPKVANGSLTNADVASFSGSLTTDFLPLNAFSCVYLTIAAPGAGDTSGDLVIANTDADTLELGANIVNGVTGPPALQIAGQGSTTANQYRVVVCNNTNASVDPPPTTYTYTAFKR